MSKIVPDLWKNPCWDSSPTEKVQWPWERDFCGLHLRGSKCECHTGIDEEKTFPVDINDEINFCWSPWNCKFTLPCSGYWFFKHLVTIWVGLHAQILWGRVFPSWPRQGREFWPLICQRRSQFGLFRLLQVHFRPFHAIACRKLAPLRYMIGTINTYLL